MQIPGGENWLGAELLHLGTSAFVTLQSVFKHITVKPGAQSWLLAGDRENLSSCPRMVADRLAGIPGLAAVYPAAETGRLYEEERADAQLSLYRQAAAENSGSLFVNTEDWPRAVLYSLLLSIKQALNAEGLLPLVTILNRAGVLVFLAWVLLYILFRVLYRLTGRKHGNSATPAIPGKGDSFYLIFSAGAAALSTYMLLMYKYQSAYGALFLHNGLFCGSTGCRLLLSRLQREPFLLLPVVTALYALLFLILFLVPGSRLLYILLIFSCGVLSGCFVPPAVHRLQQADQDAQAAGSALELFDHLGGTAGALLTGIIFLPVLGVKTALVILAAIPALNLLPHLLSRLLPGKDRADKPGAVLYLLFGIVPGLLCASVLIHSFAGQSEKISLADLAFEWTAGSSR